MTKPTTELTTGIWYRAGWPGARCSLCCGDRVMRPPGYFSELTIADGRVAAIHDFRYVRYIGRDAKSELATVQSEERRDRYPGPTPWIARNRRHSTVSRGP
jgi:hypothetical protein